MKNDRVRLDIRSPVRLQWMNGEGEWIDIPGANKVDIDLVVLPWSPPGSLPGEEPGFLLQPSVEQRPVRAAIELSPEALRRAGPGFSMSIPGYDLEEGE